MSAELAPDTDEQVQPLALTGRDPGVPIVGALTAVPETGLSPCRIGLISDLLLRCGEGDAAAFGAVMDIFYSVVVAATELQLPPGEVEAAVDLTFVIIWRESPSYRPGGVTAVEWVMGHVSLN